MSVLFEMLLGREFHALIVLGRYEYISLGPNQIVGVFVMCPIWSFWLVYIKVVGYTHVVYEWSCA